MSSILWLLGSPIRCGSLNKDYRSKAEVLFLETLVVIFRRSEMDGLFYKIHISEGSDLEPVDTTIPEIIYSTALKE